MKKEILEFESVKNIEDITTIRTDINTEDISLKQLSFNSKHS